ncbi:MAG: flagellin-like protein [Sphingomonadaceae bacterium]|nr:flagellin-like protein [Sphingomonadaceae bacterium]
MINATGNRMTQEIARQSRMAAHIADKQAQVSTGKRLQRASDDPNATMRLNGLKRAQANADARAANIGLATSMTAQADTQLRSVSALLTRAKELAIAAANGSASGADRGSIALELNAIADEIEAASFAKSADGTAIFAPGSGLAMRFDDETQFIAVPSRSEVFEIAGVPISQVVRDSAVAISAGNIAAISSANDIIGGALDHIADQTARVGLHAARLEHIGEKAASRDIGLAEERSRLQDTDLSSAIAELNGMTLTLEAAQAAFARINRRTLMDFLA